MMTFHLEDGASWEILAKKRLQICGVWNQATFESFTLGGAITSVKHDIVWQIGGASNTVFISRVTSLLGCIELRPTSMSRATRYLTGTAGL